MQKIQYAESISSRVSLRVPVAGAGCDLEPRGGDALRPSRGHPLPLDDRRILLQGLHTVRSPPARPAPRLNPHDPNLLPQRDLAN